MLRSVCVTGCFFSLILASQVFAVEPSATTGQAPATVAAPAEKPICPVMLEEVEDPADAAYSDYRGKRYYFCCPACKPKFDKNPRKYIRALENKQRKLAQAKRASTE